MNKQSRFFTLAFMVVSAALMRVVPHPWNFTPVAAMALFSGAHFNRPWMALMIPFSALFLSDLILGFHATMPFVYAAFAMSVLIGRLMRQNRSWFIIVRSSLISSVLFFLVTNFGVWLVGGLYEKTVSGMAQCFIAAIPFFRTTLAGDVLYTAVLFGTFSWAERRFLVLTSRSVSA